MIARHLTGPLPLIFYRIMSTSAIHTINPNADVLKRDQAISTIVNAALGLQTVVRTNLGPRGTMKM